MKMKQFTKFLLVIILTFFSCSRDYPVEPNGFICEITNPIEKGDRILGIDLLDLSETNSFDQNIDLANEIGVEFIALHLTWSSIETSPNVYEDPFSAMELLGQVAVGNNYNFSLTIRPIDLTGKTVPSDLENTRFNDSIMIDRFKSLVDFIFTKVNPSILLNFQIGNEIDGYDTTNEPSTFWDDYGEFLQEITNYIHSINSNVRVGYTGTHDGLLANPSLFNTLLQNVDILGVTYYPIKPDFSVKEPNTVFTDFENLVTSFISKPIYLQEVGYQTSTTSNSNEEKQAEFYCNLFKAWDLHIDKIKSLNIVRLNDLSLQGAQEAAGPYGLSNTQFIEYLRTLGIRTYKSEGSNKQAFNTIKSNALARGW